MSENYQIKWKYDLKMYVDTFSSFIFEGNVNDLQPVDGANKVEYVPLKDCIAKMFSKDYCVVFFDHTKESGKVLSTQQKVDLTNQQQTATVDDKWFNSFEFESTTIFSANGERILSPNLELFKQYYTQSYLDKVSQSAEEKIKDADTIDLRRIYDAITEFDEQKKQDKYKEAKPFMFILPDVSRYMTEAGRPTDTENKWLLMLFKATQAQSGNCKLMLFVDKANDLPTWFESENTNSAIKKMYIPVPDSTMREMFYTLEMQNVMQPVDQKETVQKRQKFSAYTENYSLRRLLQLRTFIISEEGLRSNDEPSFTDVDNIEKTVLRFESGQTKDPWRDSGLRERVKNFTEDMADVISGQDDAITKVYDALKSAVTGVNSSKKNDRRPRAILFFAGPTGVGKTETVKQIAEKIFQRQDNMIRFDMSEFREEHSDARLFGAPPGYVGYEAGGELTRAVKQNPFSVILFDEIEKAAPRIWDKFLQILGDGRLTDGKGETVYFTQSVIVFTSNLGITADSVSSDEAKAKRYIAIANSNSKINSIVEQLEQTSDKAERQQLVQKLYKEYKQRVPLVGLTVDMASDYLFTKCYEELGALDDIIAFNNFVSECVKERIQQYFENIGRREVLGRIGDSNIVVFNFIHNFIADRIAENAINKYVKYLKTEHDSRLNLTVSDKAKKYILKQVNCSKVLNMGGRGIVDCVEHNIRTVVSEYLFANSGTGLNAVLDEINDKLVVK